MEDSEQTQKVPSEQQSYERQSNKRIGMSNELMLRSMPNKFGNIYKWTNYVGGWKVRYLVVNNGFLSYYESEKHSDFHSRATVNLLHCKIGFSAGNPNCFDVSNERGVVYYFKTIGRNERDEWVSVIDKTKFILSKMMENDKLTENDLRSNSFGRGGYSTDSTQSIVNRDHSRSNSLVISRLNRPIIESPNTLIEQIMSKLSERYNQINKINKFITTDINKMIGIVARSKKSTKNRKNGHENTSNDNDDKIDEKVAELLRFRREFSLLLNKLVGCANEVTINLENDLQETQVLGDNYDGKFAYINTDEEFYSFSEGESGYANKEAITNKNKTDHISSDRNKDSKLSSLKTKEPAKEQLIDSVADMGRTYEEQCEIYFKKAFNFLTSELKLNDKNNEESEDTWTVAYSKSPTMIYSRKIEIDGIVMDPYRVCSIYKGISAKEACEIFFDPELKLDWDQHMETMDLVKWLEKGTCCLLYLTFKTVWPVTRRHSCILSKKYMFDEHDSHECTKHQKKAQDFDHVSGSKKSAGRDVLYVGPAYMVMNFSVENDSLNQNKNYVKLNALVGFVVRSFVYKSDISDIAGLEDVDEYYDIEYIKNQTLRNRIMLDRKYVHTMLNYFSDVNPGGWLPPAGVRKVARSEFPKFVASFGEFVKKNVKDKSIIF